VVGHGLELGIEVEEEVLSVVSIDLRRGLGRLVTHDKTAKRKRSAMGTMGSSGSNSREGSGRVSRHPTLQRVVDLVDVAERD
jgi:hypothetical protein